MGNPTYSGSSYSSSRSGTSQCSTLSRETTSQVRNEHRTSVKFLSWMAGGPTTDVDIRKTTTTTANSTGQKGSRQGGAAQRRSSETKETYEFVRKNGEGKVDAPYRPSYPPVSTRRGSRSGGSHPTEPPPSFRQYGHDSRPGLAGGRFSREQPLPPPRPRVDPIPPQDRRQPPGQSRNPRVHGPRHWGK